LLEKHALHYASNRGRRTAKGAVTTHRLMGGDNKKREKKPGGFKKLYLYQKRSGTKGEEVQVPG